jgi:hypothetical protein
MIGFVQNARGGAMPRRECIRTGHMISIYVDQNSKKGWHWSYMIDGARLSAMQEGPLNTKGAALL